jgi:hypothetical protein
VVGDSEFGCGVGDPPDEEGDDKLALAIVGGAENAFNLPLTKATVSEIESAMAEKYTSTYRGILRQIADGTLVHAEETKGVVKGGGHSSGHGLASKAGHMTAFEPEPVSCKTHLNLMGRRSQPQHTAGCTLVARDQ